MKVQELTVTNLGGIRYFHLVAGPHVNELVGPNGAGKSSILNALTYPFVGLRGIPVGILREGASKGEGTIRLDNGWTLKLQVKDGKSPTITIKDEAGGKINLSALKAKGSALSFDPLAFARMKPADQVASLRQLAGEEFVAELARRDAEIKQVFDARALANRMVERIGQVPKVEAVEPVDVSDLQRHIEKAEKENAEKDQAQKKADDLHNQVKVATAELLALEDRCNQLRKLINGCEDQLAELTVNQTREDTSVLRQRLVEAGETNRRAQEYVSYKQRLKERAEAAREANELTDKLEQLRKEREVFAQTAKLPVEGLSFSDDGVRWQGRPWESLCTGEGHCISARIAARLVKDCIPQLMIIREGSLLDDASFEDIAAVADEEGVQLWVETVGKNGHTKDAIRIEAGEIAELGGSDE